MIALLFRWLSEVETKEELGAMSGRCAGTSRHLVQSQGLGAWAKHPGRHRVLVEPFPQVNAGHPSGRGEFHWS